jgi:hypothetical protein
MGDADAVRTVTSAQKSRTSFMSCSIISMAISEGSLCNALSRSSVSLEGIPAAGSSRSKTRGFRANTMAISTSLCFP